MILVVGATGNVGREALDLLAAEEIPARALTRYPGKAAPPPGIVAVGGDLTRPETLPAAFAGVDEVFLILAATVDLPAQRLAAILRMAVDAGVRRLVLVSSISAATAPGNAVGRRHLELEQAVRECGLAWTFLRPGMFMSNALDWAASIRSDGMVRAGYGDLTTSPTDPADIAAVGVTALLTDGHEGRIYPLSGPAEISPREQVRVLGEVLGRPIRFEELSPVAFRRQLHSHAPPAVVDAMLAMLTSPTGGLSEVLPTVPEVLGRPARTFEQWAGTHAELFRS
ncbi:NAD(P)H-binding protein [Saccharopolyspora phatthalungensis]|uniref:Uncharacterized protein YbjT (DUF2867 family) n=1 Tax=Saccharopolyspora phatthalungensis TaxID=664693 RepID=A0A840Q680_9PSEU|nr:NAD(P)H-binding protein [Saccharopolyspora phatthalungensis]MBB5158022.1 uncharacterized protein YbjT (DUF2867 family) [Saccharopolyspora phatthalungensis]